MKVNLPEIFKSLKLLLPAAILLHACNTAQVPLEAGKKPDPALLTASAADSARTKTDTTGLAADSTALAADTTQAPKLDFLKADSTDKGEKKKPKKKKKIFLGHKIQKGYTKAGKGKSQTIEVFYYLKTYKEPSPFVIDKYYYNTKKHRIYKTRTIDPAVAKILHGPYKKMVGKNVVEQGYFYMGTKHLRWERYNKDNILLDKVHFEQGFPKDARVSYYDAARKKIKEVLPVINGEVEGQYIKFYPNGQVEWIGKYENGRKIGEWTQFYDFRNRPHYKFQYPETAYDEPFEPYLIKEYNRHGSVIYEKDKLDKRGEAENERN